MLYKIIWEIKNITYIISKKIMKTKFILLISFCIANLYIVRRSLYCKDSLIISRYQIT